MAKRIQEATNAELAILKLLWDRDSLTARAIRDELYPRGTNSDHATVQKLLQRLEKKRLIERDRRSFAHVFRALVTRDELAGQQLESLAKKLTGGSLAPFIMHAVESKRLSSHERAQIQQLLSRKD